jgi:hypothetical protein
MEFHWTYGNETWIARESPITISKNLPAVCKPPWLRRCPVATFDYPGAMMEDIKVDTI